MEVLTPYDSLDCLSSSARDWLAARFARPSAVQRCSWPAIAAGKNVLISAPTGAGKTLAAFLPLLDELLHQSTSCAVRILYVAPLKALSADVRRNVRSYLAGLSDYLSVPCSLPRLMLRTGDSSPRDRQRLWDDPPEILLTTPESLALLLTHDTARDLFRELRSVVLDEVHALAPGKRGADLSLSLERLEELTEDGPLQRIGLSATAAPLHEVARYLVGTDRPCLLAHARDAAPLELVVQPLSPGPSFLAELLDLLGPLLEENASTLLFANTRALAERIGWALRRRYPWWDDSIAVHHSSLSPLRRRRIEKKLKRGKLRAVVSSASLELGVDIGCVDQVVLVHPPGDVVRLLQRVGRAGHGPGRPRRGLVLTAGPAELLEAVVTTSAGLMGQCEPLHVCRAPLDVLCQQLLGMASTGPVDADAAFRLVQRAAPYRDLCREDFDACINYLLGCDGWLPARLLQDSDGLHLCDERTLRILRQNLGTILAEQACEVVVEETEGERIIGEVDEVYAEQLNPGERLLLDGRCLEVTRLERGQHLRLMTIEVAGRPRLPRWVSDGWPLSSELARRLFVFRTRAAEALRDGVLRELLCDEYALPAIAAEELVSLFSAQEAQSEIPDASTLLVEIVPAQSLTMAYFHTPLNRTANDALGRVLAHRLVDSGTMPPVSMAADLGLALFVRGMLPWTPETLRELFSAEAFDADLQAALADSLVLRERFQRVATTGLMLLRNPLGKRRKVGGHDWGERRLFDQVRARRPDFVLLRQAEREILSNVCDAATARKYLEQLPRLTVRCRWLTQLSPFVESWTQSG